MTRTRKKLLIECHPDRHGGDHSRMEKFFAADVRPSQSMSSRRVCRVCGVRISGVKTCRMHQWLPQMLAGMLLLVGCAGPQPKPQVISPPLPQMPVSRFVSARELAAVAAAVDPPRMTGCAWDAPTNYNPLVESFEVWATPVLTQPFTLKTNTTELKALWPMQASEFYMVRTRGSDGQVSEWATTKQGL